MITHVLSSQPTNNILHATSLLNSHALVVPFFLFLYEKLYQVIESDYYFFNSSLTSFYKRQNMTYFGTRK